MTPLKRSRNFGLPVQIYFWLHLPNRLYCPYIKSKPRNIPQKLFKTKYIYIPEKPCVSPIYKSLETSASVGDYKYFLENISTIIRQIFSVLSIAIDSSIFMYSFFLT